MSSFFRYNFPSQPNTSPPPPPPPPFIWLIMEKKTWIGKRIYM
jgi:hypothetical protein